MRARVMLDEWLIPLAITAFVVGPLTHMALHRPDHHHTSDGGVVFVERGAVHDHAQAHSHPHPHPHGAEGEQPHTHPADGDPPSHPTHHADGGAAHLGLAPPPPTPILLPRRALRGPPAAPAVRPPAYRPLRGHRYATAARARAPPA